MVRGPRRPPRDRGRSMAPVTTRFDTIDASDVLAGALDEHRRELTGYCYRMLGSAFEADDAVQETMVRAWRAIDRFEGRSSHAVVALPHRHQRLPRHAARPAAPGPADGPRARRRPPTPSAAARCRRARGSSRSPTAASCPTTAIPAERGRRARVHPPRLRHRAPAPPGPPARRAHPARGAALAGDRGGRAARHHRGVGQQRAAAGPGDAGRARPRRGPDRSRSTPAQEALLARYVDAFERYDITSLVALLHEDAVMSMPPYDFWLAGRRRDGQVVPRPGQRAARGRASWPRRPTAARPSAPTDRMGGAVTPRAPSR